MEAEYAAINAKLNAKFENIITIINWNQQDCSSPQDENLPDNPTIINQIFKPEEIGFFDPELNPSLGEEDIIPLGKKIWIWNVFTFIHQIKDVITYKDVKIMWANFPICLKDVV